MSNNDERTIVAEEIMTPAVISVLKTASVEDAAQMMLVNRIGSVAILDENGHYVGIFTERMLLPEEVMVPFMRGKTLRLLGKEVGSLDNVEETIEEVRALKIEDVMNSEAPTANRDTPVPEVVGLMVQKQIHHVIIVEDRQPIGIVSRHDLLRLFFE